MKRRSVLRASTGAVVLLLSLSAGCATWQKRRALEAVARDWCYTIRATQVLPVYPLSEDVQPGDLYLVQLPIDRQQEAYRKNGFLPLDNLIARLAPQGYGSFYAHSFGLGDEGKTLPKDFVTGDGAGWKRAPIAAFPSYAFSVKSGAGAKVAVPVSGVPVGLGLMNSDAAEGSITISDVRTYGIDTVSLFADVEAWLAGEENAEFLANFAPSERRCFGVFTCRHHNYLRVVSRVYATRKVNVSLRDSSASSGQVDVGAPKTVELLTATTDAKPGVATAANYAENVKKLNTGLAEALKEAGEIAPGGTLKVVSASSRSISLAETFPKPLVIGYLGFDMAILEDGRLGPPIPSYAVLAEDEAPGREHFVTVRSPHPTVRCVTDWYGDAEHGRERVQILNAWWAERGHGGRAVSRIGGAHFAEERARFIEEQQIPCE